MALVQPFFGGAVLKPMRQLQNIETNRGTLTVIERLPFPIRRVYYLHGINPSQDRPGHAHKALKRLMIAVSGSFLVRYRDKAWKEVLLDDPGKGLMIDPMVWVELSDFTSNAVCMVLASEEHDENDVIRDFTEFKRAKRCSA